MCYSRKYTKYFSKCHTLEKWFEYIPSISDVLDLFIAVAVWLPGFWDNLQFLSTKKKNTLPKELSLERYLERCGKVNPFDYFIEVQNLTIKAVQLTNTVN